MEQSRAGMATIGIPILTNDNFAIWQYSVRDFADENELTVHFDTNVDNPMNAEERARMKKRRAQAGRLIVSTISQNSFKK